MNFFKRDVLILLLVSILLGSVIAKAVSYGANIYFQQTLVSLVGDYGEYDLIVQIREENREDGKVQLEELLQSTLVGATYKEGPAIIGKANFFVALPQESKNRAIYENLDRVFSSIPGISGVSVITEPRINIRGVPVGTAETLEEEIQSIDGVDFVYRSGGSIGVVLLGVDKVAEVTNQVEASLTRNKIVEVSFPVGAEPDNPVMIAERITNQIYQQMHPQVAKYVSVDTSNDDIAHLVSTMKEMRRFLLTYASKVTFTSKETSKLAPGSSILFQGTEAQQIKSGDTLKRGNIVALLTGINKDGSFDAVITKGDASALKNTNGYQLTNDEAAEYVGTATYYNPRLGLIKALEETADLVERMPTLASEGNVMSKLVLDTLTGYSENADDIKKTIARMNTAVDVMQSATKKLENANIKGLKAQLDQSSKSMDGLINTLRLIRMFNPDVTSAIYTLQNTQEKMVGFRALLDGMDHITEEAVQARDILSNLTGDGQAIVEALQNFEGSKAKEELIAANQKLNELAKEDFKAFARELRYLADNTPKLVDEEIYQSIQLMDKVIEGQVIPGKRLQIMVDRYLWLDGIKPIIYAELGHENVGVFEADLGAIEPNIYLQVYQVLSEVQAVLAGLTSIVVTVLLLALDHTAIMSALRSQRMRVSVEPAKKTIAEKSKGLLYSIFYLENLYGMGIGAGLLSATFFLSGGGIPYVSWYAVPVIGLLLGLCMAYATEKITPLQVDEVLAGQSLGMSFDEIMREIVIPSGRPGLMQRLNRRKLKFK